jgi:hypothetical protein
MDIQSSNYQELYYVATRTTLRILAGPFNSEVEANAVNSIRFDERHAVIIRFGGSLDSIPEV